MRYFPTIQQPPARHVARSHHWSGAIDDATDEWLSFSVAVSVRPDQWCVFCTPFLAIAPTRCNQLDSNLANSKATVGTNSGVSLCDNSTVSRARWAFQVLQGSVETLLTTQVRWTTCNDFAPNLFWKLRIKFYQNHPFHLKILQKNHFGSFFRYTHCTTEITADGSFTLREWGIFFTILLLTLTLTR